MDMRTSLPAIAALALLAGTARAQPSTTCTPNLVGQLQCAPDASNPTGGGLKGGINQSADIYSKVLRFQQTQRQWVDDAEWRRSLERDRQNRKNAARRQRQAETVKTCGRGADGYIVCGPDPAD